MIPPDVRWIFPLLSLAISSINAICLDPRPTRLLLCYQETATPELNPCSCTHLVHHFTDIRRIDHQSGFLKSGQKHKEKNPDLKLIASISGLADDLLKDRNITARKLATALDDAQVDGVELNINWNNSQVQKQHLIDFVKKLIDEFDGKTSNRVKRNFDVTKQQTDDATTVKRNYDVIEHQTDDVTTASWTKLMKEKDSKDSNSSQSRVTRESSDHEDEYYDDNETNSAASEEEKDDNKSAEDTRLDDSFTILVRLPSRPQTLAKRYDLKQLNKYVDYFVLNTHNISDPAEANVTHHPSRLMGINDVQNADSLIDLVTGLGASQNKIVIAVPSTATKFTLKNATSNMPQSPSVGTPEILTQKQLCRLMSNGTWTVERDEDLTAPYAYNNATWVAFDDSTSASIKGKYVLLRELAGVAVMNIEAEDWSNDCTQPGPTVLSTLYDTLTNIGRKTRAAQLYSLQEQLHQASPFAFAADVQVSPYRVVRVVDRAGDIHVVRRQIKTEFECSRQGYFTHPSGCNRFYRCVKFNQYVEDYTVFEYDCPAGLAFDERYEVCVWPGSLPDGGACQGSSEIAPVPRSRYICPAVEGYYADPENCRWFFACLDHSRDGSPLTAYEFRCPFGLVFNEAQLVCDWPWNVQGCGQSGYAGARLTVGDLYEGRLRPSYASVPDYYVSGGRIQGGNAGVVLGSNLVGIPGVGQYDAAGFAYSAGGNSGIQYEGGSSNQYSEALKSGQYGSGAQLYSGSGAQYSAGGGSQYAGVNVGGYGSGGLLYSSPGSAPYVGGYGKLYGANGVGAKQSLYNAGNTVQYVGGSVGLYASDYVHDNSGAYIHDNSGDYVHDNSGDYVHNDKGYVHDENRYVHQEGKYGNGGQYIHQEGKYGNGGQYVHQDGKYGDGGQYIHQYSAGSGQIGGSAAGVYSGGVGSSSGAYIHDNSGAYVHDDKGYVHDDKGYVHEKESYGSGGQYVGEKTSGAYSGGASYYDDGSDGQYVKISGSKGQYTGNAANVYINAPLAPGQYTSGKVGYTAYSSGYSKDATYLGGNAQYASGNNGAYVHDNSGEYKHDYSGDYDHNAGGKYSEHGENYLYSTGYSGQLNTANVQGGEAYQNYAQKGYYAGFAKGTQPAGAIKSAYNYKLPVVTVTTAAPVAISSIHPAVSTVADYGSYHSAQPVSYVTPTPYKAEYVSTPAPPVAHYSPVVSTPAPPVVHYSSVSTPAPPVAHYSPVVSVSTPAPPVAHYSPVVSYSTPAPPVAHYSPVVSVSTPAPPTVYHTPSVSPVVQYHLPSVSTAATPATYHEISSFSTPAPPIAYNSGVHVTTPAPPVVYKAPTTPAPSANIFFHGGSISSTPKVLPVSPIVTPAPPVVHYSSSPAYDADSYVYNKAPVSGVAYYSTPSPPVVYQKPVQPVTTTYVASTPKPVTYYQSPAITPAPIYKKVTVVPSPAPTYISNTAAAYDYVTPTPQPVVFKSPAPVNYNPYHVGVTSVTSVPYVSNVTPCSLKEHAKYSEHVHLPIVSITPSVEYNRPSYDNGYSYPKPAIPFVHEPAVPVTAKPVLYQYKQPAPVVPVTPAPEVVHYQSIIPSPPPVRFQYKQPIAPVVPVTPAPEVVHYQSVTPSPPPVRYEYKQPVAPVVPVTPAPEVVHYQSVTPSPPPIRYEYKQPVVPVVPVTPAPEVVHYQSVAPSPPPVRFQYKQPVAPVIPVTPAPEVVHYQPVRPAPPPVRFEYKQPVAVTPAPEVIHYQSVTPSPPPVRYGYKQPVAPIVPVTPAPEIIHYESVTPAPAPAKIEYKQPVVPVVPYSPPVVHYQQPAPPAPAKIAYSYQAPVVPVKQVTEIPAVHYHPAPSPSPPSIQYQYSYKQPVVPAVPVTQDYKPVVTVTTPTPVTYTTTSVPITQYTYQKPVQPVAPLVTYSVPRKPSFSYTTVAPVTPVKQVFYQEPVTTLAPIYKQQPVNAYAYGKQTDNLYYSHQETYTSKPEVKQQYYQSPPVFSYTYKAPSKPASPVSGYYVQQGIAAQAYAPVAYNYEKVEVPKLKPIVVAPYTPAPTFVSVTTPKCESPAVHVTSSPIAYYSPTTTSAPLSTASVDYGTYNQKVNYGTKTASKVQYTEEKLPEQYLVEVTPQTETQFETVGDVNRGYKATVHTGSNIYYKSGSGYSDEKAFENFEADNYPSGYTSTTERPTVKQVYYSPKVKIPVVTTTSTEAYVPVQYSTESDDKEDELDISNEDNDDHLVSQYDSQFGSKSTEYTTAVSSTANLREGDTIVGVVKDGRSRFTGQKKKKVVVVSRLSDFNPLLVNKLGAQCDCTRVVRKRRPRPKASTQALFEPVQTTTVSYEPSYSPSYVQSESEAPEAPVVEIRPIIRRRKIHRSTTTTEAYSNDVENDETTRRVVASKQRVVLRNKPVYSAPPSEEQEYNNDPTNAKESEDLMNGRVECKRAGLFRHPKYCNKFYSCDWDKWKKKFTLNVMSCPIHLAYDTQLGACNWPSKGPACSDDNLLV
nr:PREDICTED: uncharacterized protein LOC109040634 [Bemisia tabaci]XP_018912157.1 PREDICTED: uncharacterized protein LOC109040634 [Bemisia tabaci]XP_018912158.1 PREDICTED: uncharacterized protein LOC109040634 [Bemisia tabaci]